ncbi:MAG: hypothetical protein U0446_11725 [Dehalococcoidia bacterium]
MTDFGHLTPTPGERHLRPMLVDQARHHAQLLRAAANLLLAGEPVSWSMGGFGTGLAGVSYAFDEEAFHRAAAEVRLRVQTGDGDYAIRVAAKERVRYPSRKRR